MGEDASDRLANLGVESVFDSEVEAAGPADQQPDPKRGLIVVTYESSLQQAADCQMHDPSCLPPSPTDDEHPLATVRLRDPRPWRLPASRCSAVGKYPLLVPSFELPHVLQKRFGLSLTVLL
jgi:hypothetical protein